MNRSCRWALLGVWGCVCVESCHTSVGWNQESRRKVSRLNEYTEHELEVEQLFFFIVCWAGFIPWHQMRRGLRRDCNLTLAEIKDWSSNT